MAAHALFGPSAASAWVADIDTEASALLAARFPDVPNLGDITGENFTRNVTPVDVITAGFPCQPVSVAGKRAGTADDRWIWPDITRTIDRCQPSVVMLENTPGLLTVNNGAAWREVTDDLDDLGYRWSHRVVAASDVGACHRRKRVFVLAWRGDDPPTFDPPTPVGIDTEPRLLPTPSAQESQPTDGYVTEMRAAGVDPDHRLYLPGREWHSQRTLSRVVAALLPTPVVSDAEQSRRDTARGEHWTSHAGTSLGDVAYAQAFGEYAAAVQRHADVVGIDPPEPTIDGRLSPRFVEWMMMVPAGWVTDMTGLGFKGLSEASRERCRSRSSDPRVPADRRCAPTRKVVLT